VRKSDCIDALRIDPPALVAVGCKTKRATTETQVLGRIAALARGSLAVFGLAELQPGRGRIDVRLHLHYPVQHSHVLCRDGTWSVLAPQKHNELAVFVRGT